MIEYLAIGCLLIILGIVGVKFWNTLNLAKFYDQKFIWIGLIVGLFAWAVYFICVMTSLQSITVLTASTGEIFTQTNNSYLILVNLMVLVNWCIGFIISLSVIEFILSINVQMFPKGMVKKTKQVN